MSPIDLIEAVEAQHTSLVSPLVTRAGGMTPETRSDININTLRIIHWRIFANLPST